MTRQYGLIGFPLSHSFSPKYFAEKFEREGVTNCSYESFPLESIDELKALLINKPGLCGLNVTIPYKKKVIPFLDSFDNAVSEIQACNCIKIRDRKLVGFNTDIAGFKNSLVPLLQPHHTHALILGTGGAAVAIEYALKQLGISYLFVSRNKQGESNYISYDALPECISKYSLVINTTPTGTFPNVSDSPAIPYELLTPKHYLFDLVYNPVETQFLKLGKEQGATIKNGQEMLHIQAEESWRIWSDDSL